MKIILKDSRRYFLRFDKGEDAVAGLAGFMMDKNINACTFNGVGACSMVELGHYNSHLKDYRIKPFFDEMEIISFSGNGAKKDNKPAVEAYGVFSRNDFSVLAGHVSKLTVSSTCEVFLIKLDGEMKREKNTEFNLDLLA